VAADFGGTDIRGEAIAELEALLVERERSG